MFTFRNVIVYILILIQISACAASRNSIINGNSELTDTTVCRNYLDDKELLSKQYNVKDEDELEYIYALNREIRFRSLSEVKCEQLIAQDNKEITQGVTTTIVTIGLVALTLAAAAAGSGSNVKSSGYAWDQFYDANHNLVWRCRSKATGQFAYNSSCYGQIKTDSTWQGK